MKLSATLLAALLTVLLAVTAPVRADDTQAVSDAQPAASFADRYLGKARELALQALGFIGINYKFGGNTPETGFDCSGFVRYVFNQAAGLLLPRNALEISRVGQKIDRTDLQPGDLVFFNTLRRPFSHVGIYLGDNRFIHAPARGGSVEIVNMNQRYWEARFNGARRITL